MHGFASIRRHHCIVSGSRLSISDLPPCDTCTYYKVITIYRQPEFICNNYPKRFTHRTPIIEQCARNRFFLLTISEHQRGAPFPATLYENRLRQFKSTFQQQNLNNCSNRKVIIYSESTTIIKGNEAQLKPLVLYPAFISQFVFHRQCIQELCQFLNHRHHKSDRTFSDCQLKFWLSFSCE